MDKQLYKAARRVVRDNGLAYASRFMQPKNAKIFDEIINGRQDPLAFREEMQQHFGQVRWLRGLKWVIQGE